MSETQSPCRLIPLKEALARISSSERSYHRNPSLLPVPIRRGGRLLFVEAEVDAHIRQMAALPRSTEKLRRVKAA